MSEYTELKNRLRRLWPDIGLGADGANAIQDLELEVRRLRMALHSITLSYDERCGIDHATLARSALEAKP